MKITREQLVNLNKQQKFLGNKVSTYAAHGATLKGNPQIRVRKV